MHVQRVVTNETCNQNCWFCNARRPAEDPKFVSRAAVRQRIVDAQGTDTREIVLTGGEPTLRSDLADLVRRAAAAGSARVVLETNATRIDEGKARDLANAGLALARVQLVAWGADAADAITREPGGFAAAMRGLRALADAGIAIEVTTPIVRRNVALVAAMPAAIAASDLPVAALVLVVPSTAPDAVECAALAEVATAITTVADEARRVGLPLRLDPTTYVPPCVFERPERVAHLFALNRGNASRPGYERVTECADCLVADRCPGVPAGFLHGDVPRVRPVTELRLRRRLTVVSTVEEQVARELASRDDVRGDGTPAEVTVRVNFRCNQACEFCFVSTHLPSAPEAAVRAAIETAAREHAIVVLSGGEPTLNPRLVEYVELASRLGAASVELQSNATRLAHAGLAAALADAGLQGAMISLHGATAAVSDAVTGAPGTFVATLKGIDALVQTPVRVRLNFVFCQENRDDFPAVVDLVAARWPTAGIVFSFVGSHTDVVPRSTALIPRFSDVMPSLLAGLARARAAGLAVTGFDSMCGLPLCLVPDGERAAFSPGAVPDGAGEGEFVKAETCAGCAETHRCFGVRRGYAELYGTGELQPIAASERSSRSPALA